MSHQRLMVPVGWPWAPVKKPVSLLNATTSSSEASEEALTRMPHAPGTQRAPGDQVPAQPQAGEGPVGSAIRDSIHTHQEEQEQQTAMWEAMALITQTLQECSCALDTRLPQAGDCLAVSMDRLAVPCQPGLSSLRACWRCTHTHTSAIHPQDQNHGDGVGGREVDGKHSGYPIPHREVPRGTQPEEELHTIPVGPFHSSSTSILNEPPPPPQSLNLGSCS
ncbi:uncharacterized protein LOC122559369 [Chiloscyllium plagiosum]|uniref:uncharacterized protein LOC122559369 n=1 Tax=Chiloscyllium plagiosum TaxID=36176 RepID=UPI001CB8015C|nr:uncharacterized protein LOC122559369 [Chiloscyllium plagiosum]